MNKIIKLLPIIPIATVLAPVVISCNKTSIKYKVNNEEWNEAVENIVNYKKNNELNYVATSDDMVAKVSLSSDEELSIKEIEVNNKNKTQRIQAIYKGYSLDPFNYVFYKVNDNVYFQVAEFIDKDYDYAFKQNNPTQIFNGLLDLYDNIDAFSFNDSTKTYNYSQGTEGQYIHQKYDVIIKFENNRIKTLSLDYSLSSETTGYIYASLKGTLNFNYGVSTLTQKMHINELNSRLYSVTKTDTEILKNCKLKPVFLTVENYVDPITHITVEGTKTGEQTPTKVPVFFESNLNDTLVFVNGKLLERGTKQTPKDYYFDDLDESTSTLPKKQYRELHFTEPISGKRIEICLNSLNAKSGHGDLINYPTGPFNVYLNKTY